MFWGFKVKTGNILFAGGREGGMRRNAEGGRGGQRRREEVRGGRREERGRNNEGGGGVRRNDGGEMKEGEIEKEQSQKRCMVSGSLCPLISFLDVSYSASFLVRTETKTKKTRKTEKISLCGDAIGHRPLRGRCPLTKKLTE